MWYPQRSAETSAPFTARIALKAKRLLVHTDRPIYLIAESLGFEEATNFAKFFKRETDCTPISFRRQYKG